jgi:hypothetical protein
MHLEVPAEFLVEQYRDIGTFMRANQAAQIGTFDNPARLEDLRGLTLEASDIQAIRECEVGDCDLKMPATVLDRLHREVDWSKSDFQQRVEAAVGQMLVDYVTAYRAGGTAAMGQYDDQQYPLRMADEFRELLGESRWLYEFAPEFQNYLERYPLASLQDVDDFLVWTKVKYEKIRPIVSVAHSTIYKRSQGKVRTWIASKQIYASHYFEASLELSALVEEAEGAERPGIFLLYLNRSRLDTLRRSGFVGKKHTVRSELLKKVDQEMKSTKVMIETLYREVSSPAVNVPVK